MNSNVKPRTAKKDKASASAPEVPPLRPAALEPEWSKGKLILLPKSAESDCESVVLAAIFNILRAEFARLAADADADGTIDQRAIYCLRSVANRIPAHPPAQDELFYLAHLKEFLEAYLKFAGEEWPDFFTKRFAEVTHYFDRVIQQFPKWREFVSNAEKYPLTSEEVGEIPALATTVVEALREDEARNLIDPAIPSALEVFQAPLQSTIVRSGTQTAGAGDERKLRLANDVLASIDNIIKRTAEAALEIRNIERPNWPGIANEEVSSAEKDREQAYNWMTKTLSKIMTSTPTLALNSKLCWLKPIMCLVGN